MKSLIILFSYHHKNTEKIAKVFAEVFGAQIKTPQQIDPEELREYDLICFGSGIYDDKHHVSLLDLADKLPDGFGKNVFIFSTSGVPVAILGDNFLNNYLAKAHATLKNKLESKGCKVLGDFISPGFNTNVFLKYFGGLNKNRPNQKDFERAREFALKIKSDFISL
jgi:flavodoxin